MPLSRADRRRSKVSLQLKPSELKAVEKQMKRVEDMRAEVCSWLRAFKPRCDAGLASRHFAGSPLLMLPRI